MIIEQALVGQLAASAALVQLVGNRIHPVRLPQGSALPALCYQRISTPRVYSHSGPSGLARPRFQLTAWGATLEQVVLVCNAARAALDGYKGMMGGSGGGVRVDGIETAGEYDLPYEPDTDRYGRATDYYIWHAEP